MNIPCLLTRLLVLACAVSVCGCSTTSTVDLSSDPAVSLTVRRLKDGEPIEIVGYTRASDGHREWEGVVQLAPPDSVRFTRAARRSVSSRPPKAFEPLSFTIPRWDLQAIDIRGRDPFPRPAGL